MGELGAKVELAELENACVVAVKLDELYVWRFELGGGRGDWVGDG